MKKARGFIFGRGGVIVAIIMALTISPVGLAFAVATLTGLDIVNGSIKTVDLGKAAVTGKKLAANSVGTAKIVDGSIQATDLAAGVALSGPAGAQGIQGLQGIQGATGTNGLDGLDGVAGTNGTNGIDGTNGINGIDGLNGTNGVDGLNGTNGLDGTNGADGLSAYQVAVLLGFVGDEATWLASLVGPAGSDGTNGVDGLNGTNGVDGINGINGIDGLSAYEVAVANGFIGTEAEWLASLVGPAGADGADGAPGPTYVAGNGSITITGDTTITVSQALIDYINALEARVAGSESTTPVPYIP